MTLGGTVGGLALLGLELGGSTGGGAAGDVLDRTSSSWRRRAEESTSAPHPMLSSVGGFESIWGASSLRPTPVCEIMSRDHLFPAASTALVPWRQMSVLPDGMRHQTHQPASTRKFVGTARGLI